MDEIDAALDFRNVSIVAHYIKVPNVYPLHSPELKRSNLPCSDLIMVEVGRSFLLVNSIKTSLAWYFIRGKYSRRVR